MGEHYSLAPAAGFEAGQVVNRAVTYIRPLLVENVFQVTRPHPFFSAASKAHYVLLLFTRLSGHEPAFLLNTNYNYSYVMCYICGVHVL